MMKIKYILIYLSLQSILISLRAQIGINTESPQALFHIDARANNNAGAIPTPAQALDDVVITSTGNVGIGTVFPKRKLHIVTGGTVAAPQVGLRIEDGNQGANRVLQSDANGVGKWQNAPTPSALIAYRSASAPDVPTNASTYYNTGSYVSLPPGKWFVTVNTLVYSGVPSATSIHDRVFCHASFTEVSSMSTTLTATNISADVKDKKQIASLVIKRAYNVLIGSFIIINTGANTKNYYLMFGNIGQMGTSTGSGLFGKVAGSANAENTIVGIQIQ